MDYELHSDKLDVTFKSFGGTLKSIRDKNGLERLWQGDPAYWSGQSPVLFPICGSIRNNMAFVGSGKAMHMPRHGIIRKKEYTMEEKTADRITFSTVSDEKTREQFPYNFKVSEIFTLNSASIKVTYRVQNTGSERMPFFIGGHPAFVCPVGEDERFEDYKVIFPQKETVATPAALEETGLQDTRVRTLLLDDTDTLQLNYDYFNVDSRVLDTLKSRSVRMISDKSGMGIRLDFPDFPYLLLWNTKRARFLAMEPWTGISTTTEEDDIFEHKQNVQFADPGEAKDYSYTITVLG